MSETKLILAFVDAWNNKDASLLAPYLKEDFHYSSFWVYDEIKTSAEYLEYLSGKFNSILNSGSKVIASMANSRKPTIIIQQDNGKQVAIILEVENGLVARADMMPIEFLR